MTADLAKALEHCRANRDGSLEKLVDFLRIPSISTLPKHRQDVAKAAAFVTKQLTEIGMENVKVIKGNKKEHPLVIAEWMHADSAQTVLLYAHYDVQPVDPLNLWTTPPFEPAIRDGFLYARGSADDKGQLLVLLNALGACLKTSGKLPVNVKVLFEGEEESGGEHIGRYVESMPAFLKGVTSVVVLDSGMHAPGLPSITTALRGIITAELTVRTLKGDQHSGMEGGTAPNANDALATILTAIKTPTGRVRIPGFYKQVRKPNAKELASWSSLPYDEGEHLEALGASALIGDKRYSALYRQWALPTFEVNGITGGFTGEGFKTVIPAVASAKVSMRLVPGMNPDQTSESLRRFVNRVAPDWAQCDLQILHAAKAMLVETNAPAVKAAAEALKETFAHECAYIRCGGSIPIADAFQTKLRAPVVITGFTLPNCNLHAPNENMSVENFHLGVEAIVRFFHQVAQ